MSTSGLASANRMAGSSRYWAEWSLFMRVLVGQCQSVMGKTHRIAVVALDGVTALDIAIPVDVFTIDRDVPYDLRSLRDVGLRQPASGLALAVGHGLDAVGEADTVIVPGYQPVDRPVPAPVLDALARVRRGCPGGVNLHWGVRVGGRWRPRWSASHHALAAS